ncbi:TPA: assembly protein [Vibrio harveyi]|nr:assembly protein [Vibrio harveyi]
MIYAIVGRPGGGKSYEAVTYHVIPAIEQGRKVITNLTLNVDHFCKIFGEHVRDLIQVVDGQLDNFGSMSRPFSALSDYQDEWRNASGQGPLYVIDEAHMSLPNRKISVEVLEWYSMHRHYGVDLILVTQSIKKIHTDIKEMVEVTYRCTKNTALGSNTSYTKKVQDGWRGDVVNTSIRKYKSSYFPFYKSHSKSNAAVLEAQAQDIVPLWRRWPIIGSAIFLTLGSIFMVFAVNHYLGNDETIPDEVQAPVVQVPDSTQVPVSDVKPKKKDTSFGPLEGFAFYVSGYAKQIAYTNHATSYAELNSDLTFYKIYIDVYQDDNKLFTFSQLDFQNMGYTFNVLGECVFEVSWVSESRIITCGEKVLNDSPNLLSDALPISI